MKIPQRFSFWINSVLNSYAQVFFSLNKVLAITLFAVTFINPSVGVFGLLSVLGSNVMAYVLGFDKKQVEKGIYGFNALLLGLALGYLYAFSLAFLLLFIISIFAVFFITAALQASMGKINLPFLSLPFLFCYWMIALASPQLSALSFKTIQTSQVEFNFLEFPAFWKVFFNTLSATFFNKSVWGGLLIAIALFLSSRIAFSLALLAYLSAYGAYQVFGVDVAALTDNLVGSNFIFFGIAIGCFYLIPNVYSFLTVIVFTPILMLLLVGLNQAFAVFHLNGFTLAFTLLTMLVLYALHHRWIPRFLYLVQIQYYSAETTIYKYLSAVKRLKYAHHNQFSLPFFGSWKVSQGYEGKLTHLGEWSNALDFVIGDEQNKTYQLSGLKMSDYYCYNKPVLAPADGLVIQIVNHIDDNEVGEVDTKQNWGNTIILKHAEGLFSQISHLKKDSFKVNEGAWVSKGTVIANCGASGRSPEPHIHFQIQQSPLIGSKTLTYPIAYFMSQDAAGLQLNYFEVPKEDAHIFNVETQSSLKQAFDWQPGKKLVWFNQKHPSKLTSFEVFTDAYNRTYIFCASTGSYAYFINDGTRFYFTDFEGDKKGFLFQLYLSCFSVLLAHYPSLKMKDNIPQIHFQVPILHWVQDVVAPFYVFNKVVFEGESCLTETSAMQTNYLLSSEIVTRFMGLKVAAQSYKVAIGKKGLEKIEFQQNGFNEEWLCIN